ncbi:extracellular substrate binding-like orphan protein GrrP [Synechococcus sp. CBW1004]|uniref:extracellular substrate binding-like orphan protein GrrP n=1 Tax=Synechococcus sp. CBW1004 TaxID=1353136 RepID=UPI0018CFAC58|nr:extracellular substrate binding-like orphan protein GrrP [Synechococcus sp. CBW1004]QPN62367.1 transporter substrate-binding domain-containing protein [Synechococcus sp. CBW1004]
MPRHPFSKLLPARILPAALLLATALAPVGSARAEGVVQRVVRSGQLVLAGPSDAPPLLSTNANGDAQGYAAEIARLVQAELTQIIGKPVQLRFEAVATTADQINRVAGGKADLACGVPFSWAQDASSVDFTLPIGLSGLRLLAPSGRFDGSPAGLSGRRIGVAAGSLGQSQLLGMQPKAVAVPFPSAAAAVNALIAGQVDGVIGDSLLLRSLARKRNATNLVLTPEQSYQHYAVSCVVPENDSAFRDVVNLAIARLMQAYLDGAAEAVALVHRSVGPDSSVAIPPETIRIYFENVMFGVEPIRPLPPGQAPSARPGN